jgi:hypothetical protein
MLTLPWFNVQSPLTHLSMGTSIPIAVKIYQRFNMQKYLKTLAVAALLSVSALSQAAPLAVGLYTVELYNDVINTPSKTWDVCIAPNNTWYVKRSYDAWLSINGYPAVDYSGGAGQVEIAWAGSWFNKGNDTYFQSHIYRQDTVMSFHVSRINHKLLTGYFTALTENLAVLNMTMTLTRKKLSCQDNKPPFEIPIFYPIH